MTDALVVFVTAPSADQAAALARALVEEKLAACGNVLPQIRSIYRWQGAVHDEPEALLVLKTTQASFERLRARVVELHPYDTPEVLALPVQAGHLPYLDWIRGETAS